MSVSKDLVNIISSADAKGTKPYDTFATVTRVEGSTVWVHIPGGVDETPVKKTISAKPGDVVQVRVSGGSAWLNGNASAPPTDDTTAMMAVEYSLVAGNAADSAVRSAETASEAAADAQATADSVRGIAEQAQTDADKAKDAADNASEYAARALGNLSTVQSITETLNWITQHGTMTLTTDVALDPTHVYFVQDAGGDYVVGGVTYAVVTEPDVADIGTYYELSIDESLNNYVGTHLALTSEGLWLIPEAGGNKVLIATGGVGHTYEDAGTYIIDENDNVLAQFFNGGVVIGKNENGSSRSELTSSGMKITRKNGGVVYTLADIGYDNGYDSSGQLVQNPYYSFGRRLGDIGNYSLVQGMNVQATAYASRAQGESTKATAGMAVAEGYRCTASGARSHAFGQDAVASGMNTLSQGYKTTAGYADQTVIGRRNLNNSLNAFEIGNGEEFGDTYSNALAVDWDGKIQTAQMQSGNVGATSVSGNSYTDVNVTFDKTMSAVPKVVCGIVSTSTAGAIGSISVAVVSTSTTGFTARIFNAGSTGRSPGFNWLALNI